MVRIFLLVTTYLLFAHSVKAQAIAFQATGKNHKVPKLASNYFRNELVLKTENDFYARQGRDGYYTNGIFFTFLWAAVPKNAKNAYKTVHGLEIGQEVYNPVKSKLADIRKQDRPFAGYLFAKYYHKKALNNGGLLGWNAAVGLIGPPSGAESFQRWYHNILGIYDVKGWSTQLRTEVNINIGLQYAKSFLTTKSADISMLADAQIGNVFTGAMGGMLLRLGQFEQHGSSVHWQMRSSSEAKTAPVKKREAYIYFQPALTFQGYYAILQGGLFTNNKGPFTTDVNHLVYSQQIGFKFAKNRKTLSACYIFRGKQATTQIRNENFVSLQLAYLFGVN